MEYNISVKNIILKKTVIIFVMVVTLMLLAIHVYWVQDEKSLEKLVQNGVLIPSTIEDIVQSPSNKNEVFLELEELNEKEIRYQLKNMSLDTIVPEKGVILEVMYQGEWYHNPYNDDISFTLLLQEIVPNDTLSMCTSVLTYKYHGKGHYRFVQPYSMPKNSQKLSYSTVLYFDID